MRIGTLPDGMRIVKRYLRGRCYACVWAGDTPDNRIVSDMAQGRAPFFPYDESKGEFRWGQTWRARHFKR